MHNYANEHAIKPVSPERLDSISAFDREKGMMGVFGSFLLHRAWAAFSLCCIMYV